MADSVETVVTVTQEFTVDAPIDVGAIVHYVLTDGPNVGHHRPAIVVRVWPDSPPYGPSVNLQVFTDSGDDLRFNDALPFVLWATSVKEDAEAMKPGTWHWPELPEIEEATR